MLDFTTLAAPIANTQIYEEVLLPAVVANWRCRLPTSDCFHTLSAFFRLPPDFLKELTKGEVRDLASPKSFHFRQGSSPQKSRGQTYGRVPKQVSSDGLRADGSESCDVSSRIVLTRTLAVIATPHLTRHLAIGLFHLFLPTAYRTLAIRISCHPNRSERSCCHSRTLQHHPSWVRA